METDYDIEIGNITEELHDLRRQLEQERQDHAAHVMQIKEIAAQEIGIANERKRQLRGECLVLADVMRDAYGAVKTIEGEDSDECDKMRDLRIKMEYALAPYTETPKCPQ